MSQLASDNFPGASPNVNWSFALGALGVNSGVAWLSNGTSSQFDIAKWSGVVWPNDQYVELTYAAFGSGQLTMISSTLRTSGNNGYVLYCDQNNLRIYKVVSGVFTAISPSFVSTTVNVGDVIRFQVQGTTLTVLQNGVQKDQQTDSTFASGSAGIGGFVQAGGTQLQAVSNQVSLWTAGDFPANISGNAGIAGATVTLTGDASASTTVSGGVPAEYATVDEVGQTAAITTTTLYMPAATGWYRISVYAKVTTPDGASSSLGGSAGLTIGYTDGVDSTVQTLIAQLAKETGATAIVNAGNTTATKLVGQTQVFAKTGVAITYAFDYTSGTPATMAYELHLKLEAL